MSIKTNSIFSDKTGKRFAKVKTSLLFLVSLLIIVLTVAFASIWARPNNFLAKKSGDSNFDVVDNISVQVKDAINIIGSGGFAQINRSNNKNYSLTRYGNSSDKKIVITFDDGPHPAYTPKILQILKSEGVKATFFMIGQNAFNYPTLVKEVSAAGMEIGNHTFTHKDADFVNYSQHKNSPNMDFELNFTQNLLQTQTGMVTKLFRPPFWGTENDITINILGQTTFALDKGYIVSTPTVDSSDWKGLPAEQILANSTIGVDGTVILLLHDGGGNRDNTLLALKEIIDHYKMAGYQFTTLASLLGQKTMLAPTIWEKISSSTSVSLYWFSRNFNFFLNPIFIFGLVFSLSYSSLTVFLSLLAVLKENTLKKKLRKNYSPTVAVLIPAFNEEKLIAKTITSVLASTYPKLEVVIIDDGSTDKTYQIVQSFKKDRRLRIYKKKNGGKFSALNIGIKKINSEIYLSIDADTQILPNTISKIVRFFQFRNIGAVGGNVRVGNQKNLLGIMQSIEYTSNLNLERNAFSLLNSILVIPGALGAWRTKAVKKVGGYLGSTITEDAELTLRMLKNGYSLHYDKEAIAYTEAPQNIKNLISQRFRWTYGILQTFYLYRSLLFKRKQKFLGLIILPFNVFVQIPLMILTPIMDLLAISYLFFVSLPTVAFYIVLYLVLRAFITLLAYIIGHEKPWPILFTPAARFFYQPLLYVALYLALYKILQGTVLGWNKPDRHDSVTVR